MQNPAENKSREGTCWFLLTGDIPSVSAETGYSGHVQDMMCGLHQGAPGCFRKQDYRAIGITLQCKTQNIIFLTVQDPDLRRFQVSVFPKYPAHLVKMFLSQTSCVSQS